MLRLEYLPSPAASKTQRPINRRKRRDGLMDRVFHIASPGLYKNLALY